MLRIIEQNLDEIIRICPHRRVHRLAVFGSATDDRFDPDRSDLDLLVEFEILQQGLRIFFISRKISQPCFPSTH
jgi:predicted nucleotidyltransferase